MTLSFGDRDTRTYQGGLLQWHESMDWYWVIRRMDQ